MRVLVTGSTGRIGRSACIELAERGHDVIGLDLSSSMRPDLAVDLRKMDETHHAVAEVRPDAVIHLAGISDPFSRPADVVFAANVTTTFHVCQAATDLEVRAVVVASSPTVIGYGNPRGWVPSALPIDETHPTAPWHAYAMAKVAIEDLVRGFAVKAGTSTRFFGFRPCYVIAPEEWCPGTLTQQGHSVADRLRKPELAAGSLFNYVDARDAATFVARLCERSESVPGGEIFFVGAPDALAVEPLSALLPRFHPAAEGRVSDLSGSCSAFSNAKATRLLGWEPVRSWRTELLESL